MELLAQAHIPKLYDVILTWDYSMHINSYTACIYHVPCGRTFTADFRSGSQYRRDESDSFYCPHCGQPIVREYAHNFLHTAYAAKYRETHTEKSIPRIMWLCVKEYKNYVDLVAKYHSVLCDPSKTAHQMTTPDNRLQTTIIRADIRRQNIIVLEPKEESHTVIDPVLTPDWAADTVLRYLDSASYAGKHLSAIRDVIGAFQHAIERKLQQKLGYRVPSFYSPTTLAIDKQSRRTYGALNGPLRNIAWRLAAPTALNFNRKKLYTMMGDTREYPEDRQRYRIVLKRTRQGQEYFSTVADAFGIPNTPGIRKALRAGGLFCAPRYKLAAETTDDVNHIATLGHRLSQIPSTADYEAVKNLIRDIGKSPTYGPKVAIQLLSDRLRSFTFDTGCTYNRLTPTLKTELWAKPRVKVRDLHDTVMALYDKLRFSSLPIPVSDLSKTLPANLGEYTFYTPEKTEQLVTMSDKLHNCVKTYREQAASGYCIIVGVQKSDKLYACVEVVDGRIVQAKLDHNKAGKKDAAFAQVMRHWAAQKNLTIATADLEDAP